jgi:hypothetical protein
MFVEMNLNCKKSQGQTEKYENDLLVVLHIFRVPSEPVKTGQLVVRVSFEFNRCSG